MIRVLVVEDSPVARELLCHILSSDPDVQVIGSASSGEQALGAVASLRPDIITMDIHMPGIDGFDTTRQIMESRPTPIVIVSGTPDIAEKVMVFRAMEAGAIAVLSRPAGPGHADYWRSAAELVRTVKLMSEVKVVRRWKRPHVNGSQPSTLLPAPERKMAPPISIVAIGASTGGPLALQTIVQGLPSNFRVPVVIVQHITVGFTDGFAEWLGHSGSLPVHVAAHGEIILPGHIYVAPDDHHLNIVGAARISLTREAPDNGLRPSVARLFRSVAAVYGSHAAAVLLSGMGKDGAEELKALKDKGAVTIAQDKESSVVHGMPGEAIRLGAATYVLPPERIAPTLLTLLGGNRI